jgi:tetratricopeptide (TPR) repeat protein
LPFYERALRLRQELAAAQPDNMEMQSALGTTLDELAVMSWQLEHDEQAAKYAEAATAPLKLAVEKAPAIALYRRSLSSHLINHATLEREWGRPQSAAQMIAEMKKLWPDQPEELYQAAAQWAMTAGSMEKEAATWTADQKSLHDQCQEDAIKTLAEAIAAGFHDAARLKQDPHFDSLRELPAFKALMATDKTPGSQPPASNATQ